MGYHLASNPGTVTSVKLCSHRRSWKTIAVVLFVMLGCRVGKTVPLIPCRAISGFTAWDEMAVALEANAVYLRDQSGSVMRYATPHLDGCAVVAKGCQGAGIACSRDGKLIAYACSSKIHICRDDGEPVIESLTERSEVTTLALSQDERAIIVGTALHGVAIWSLRTRQLMKSMQYAAERVEAVQLSPDGKQLASLQSSNVVCLWDFKSGDLQNTIKFNNGQACSIMYYSNRLLVVGLANLQKPVRVAGRVLFYRDTSTLLLLDVTNAATLVSIQIPDGRLIHSLAPAPWRGVVIGGTTTGELLAWHPGRNKPIRLCSIAPPSKSVIAFIDQRNCGVLSALGCSNSVQLPTTDQVFQLHSWGSNLNDFVIGIED